MTNSDITFSNFNFFKTARGQTIDFDNLIETTYLWKAEEGLKDPSMIFLSQKEFQGFEFLATVNVLPPFVIADPIPPEERVLPLQQFKNYRGYEIDVWNALSQYLNFKINWINPPKDGWGRFEANGSWNGMMKQVMTDEADFQVSIMIIHFMGSQVNQNENFI